MYLFYHTAEADGEHTATAQHPSTASHALQSVVRVTNKMFPRIFTCARPSMLLRLVWPIILAVFVRVFLSDELVQNLKNY